MDEGTGSSEETVPITGEVVCPDCNGMGDIYNYADKVWETCVCCAGTGFLFEEGYGWGV